MQLTMCYPGGRKKAVTFSYDDGVAQDERLIAILNQHHLKGTFNINGGFIATDDAVNGKGRMSRAQILKVYFNSGHEVAIHGYKHPFLDELPAPNITMDVLTDRLELEKIFGTIIRGMAYPNGGYSDDVVECLKASGIAYARTTVSTENFELPKDWLRLPATCHHNHPRLFELAEQFLSVPKAADRKCWLFYLWGHSYEFDRDDNWDIIERFAEKIGGHEDVWYATNIEIYDYIAAYRQLRYNAEGTLVYNPTQIDVWISYYGNIREIKAGTMVQLS